MLRTWNMAYARLESEENRDGTRIRPKATARILFLEDNACTPGRLTKHY
jgi:hypothetical protein